MTDTTTTGRKAVSYPTRRAAHDALCLDAGFDPFAHGGVRTAPSGRVITRPTITGLRALGYRVVRVRRPARDATRETGVATRADLRYVASDSPHALLRAWGGPDATMDMGGWTDLDRVAFEAAVQDESLHSAGERLSHVSIHAVERDGRPSGHQDRPEETP